MPRINHIARQLLTGLAAITILALAATNASARTFSLSNQNFRATWGSLEFFNTVNANTVRCPVTLEGGFHTRTIAKVPNSLVGYITRGDVNNSACTGGRATFLNESLPWHITYVGFEGRLPVIGSIRINIIRASFQIETSVWICLASTTAAQPASFIIQIGADGVATGLAADPTRNITLRDPPGRFEVCFLGSGRFSGTAGLALLGTTTRITVTLI